MKTSSEFYVYTGDVSSTFMRAEFMLYDVDEFQRMKDHWSLTKTAVIDLAAPVVLKIREFEIHLARWKISRISENQKFKLALLK